MPDPVAWTMVEPGWVVVASDGSQVGKINQIIGDSGDIAISFPGTVPYPLNSAGSPANALIQDFVFVVIGQDPAAWSTATGVHIGTTYKKFDSGLGDYVFVTA